MDLIESIYAKMEALIGAIRAGDAAGPGSAGYFHDWNPCNVFDGTQYKPGPNADIFLRAEGPIDQNDGNTGGDYGSILLFDLEVHFVYRDAPKNPQRQAQIDLWKCQADLKRLFGRESSLGDSGAFHIDRNGETRIEFTQLADRPGKLISPWKVTYWQNRENPDRVGG